MSPTIFLHLMTNLLLILKWIFMKLNRKAKCIDKNGKVIK